MDNASLASLFLALLGLDWSVRPAADSTEWCDPREVRVGQPNASVLVAVVEWSHDCGKWFWRYPFCQYRHELWKPSWDLSPVQSVPERVRDRLVREVSEDLEKNADSGCGAYLLAMITGERGPLEAEKE